MAVTLTWHAPLSKAPGPGLSISWIEPSGVCLSRFCLSSRRSLGHGLLLGQRSRLNFFPHSIGSLFHQDHRNQYREFSGHRHNGHPRRHRARVALAHRPEKFPQLTVFSDRRPGGLDEFASQPRVSAVSDRSSIGSLSGGVLGRDQAEKAPSWRTFLSSRQSPILAKS